MAGRKILMVEGKDDEHVVKHICAQHNIPGSLEFKTHSNEEGNEGVDALVDSIAVRLLQAREVGDTVGILVDADENAQNRWQSIRDRIASAGYVDLPDQPDAGGTIIEPPPDTILPRAGVWIMPNNQTPGILEGFLRFLVPAPNPLFERAQNTIACIPATERRFRKIDEPKALIHTWLAWQANPGRPFGTAITARFLDPTVPEASVFAGWLKRLFFPDVP